MYLRAMVIVLLSATATAAQTAAPERGAVSLVGCLEPVAGETQAFVLKDARPAASEDTRGTSAGAGTSATGDRPSGSVSGDTPTGSTATETSAPTPATGQPEASANPASGEYNQGTRDVTAGTAGSVPRADAEPAAPVRRYRVEGAARVDLKAHAGHTVRVEGMLKAAAAPGNASAPAAAAREPVVTVTSVRHIEAACEP